MTNDSAPVPRTNESTRRIISVNLFRGCARDDMISSEEFMGDYCELRMVVESERAVQKSSANYTENTHAVEAT